MSISLYVQIVLNVTRVFTHITSCRLSRVRPVPEAGGRDPSLHQTVHHGCEAGSAELRSVCIAGETGAADQEIPADGGDRLPGARPEGESAVLPLRT